MENNICPICKRILNKLVFSKTKAPGETFEYSCKEHKYHYFYDFDSSNHLYFNYWSLRIENYVIWAYQYDDGTTYSVIEYRENLNTKLVAENFSIDFMQNIMSDTSCIEDKIRNLQIM